MIPMLGAIMAAHTPGDSKLRPKPKTKAKGGHTVTKGEKSVTQPAQQHGELSSSMVPERLSDRQLMKEHAKNAKRRATEDWVSGRVTTHEHNAVHKRADHVLSGKHPKHYSGPSGERKIKGL